MFGRISMKTPICKICLNSEILCAGCQDKVDKGEVSLADIDLVRALNKLSDKYPVMDKIEFRKTMAAQNFMLVVVPKGMAGQFIGRRGIFIKELSDTLGKKIKVIEETPNTKEFVQRALFPARLLGVNVVYTSDKKEAYKVRVLRNDRNKILDKEALEGLFTSVLGGETTIAFE